MIITAHLAAQQFVFTDLRDHELSVKDEIGNGDLVNVRRRDFDRVNLIKAIQLQPYDGSSGDI